MEYEINRIPDEQRRQDALAILAVATEKLTLSRDIEMFAENLEKQGIDAMDAVHLAFASSAQAHFFVTCDSAFLRKARRCTNLSCRCISTLDILSEVEP